MTKPGLVPGFAKHQAGFSRGREARFFFAACTMTILADVSDMLKAVRREGSLSQDELARRAGVARTTVARMEKLAKNGMSVPVLVRLLEAAGYDLKVVAHGHRRTLEDIFTGFAFMRLDVQVLGKRG